MLLQILSDLHLETESFDPQPAPGADVLILAGDIDSTWRAYERFAGWPVPVLVVAGNHEFDRRELFEAWPNFAEHCLKLGFTLLECDECTLQTRDGRRVRFLGTVRWSDFDLFGPEQRPRAMRAAGYFQKVMAATRGAEPFDAAAVREEALQCRAWLEQALAYEPKADATVVITHFAPSIQSLDTRYGKQPTTASFCNNDESLAQGVDLWIHGHLHARFDYRLPGAARVVCNARGLEKKGESQGHDAFALFRV